MSSCFGTSSAGLGVVEMEGLAFSSLLTSARVEEVGSILVIAVSLDKVEGLGSEEVGFSAVGTTGLGTSRRVIHAGVGPGNVLELGARFDADDEGR